jgi:hypothetical protein
MSPQSVALISFNLCLPVVILFTLLMFNLEPNLSPIEPWFTNPNPDQPDVLGSFIAFCLILLVLVGFSMNVVVLVHTARAGGKLFTYPMNFTLAVAMLFFITVVINTIIVDQYPCWIGVPNCD